MKFLNDLREVPIVARGDREVSGLVRVRGVDARAGRRGFVTARYEPEAVVVRANGMVSRLTLPQREAAPTAALIAAPLAYMFIRALMARRSRP